MAPKPLPDPNRSNPVTWLAASAAFLAFITLVVPLLRDFYLYANPRTGTLEFDLSPEACKEVLMGAHREIDPCTVHARYAVEPMTRDLIVFSGEAEIRIPNWKRNLRSIDGKPPGI